MFKGVNIVNMCGIFAILNNDDQLLEQDFIMKQFNKGKGRGPENSTYKIAMVKVNYGFHRLAINGLNANSNQPITIGNVVIICNGEIYNYKELYEEMKIIPTTDSDCEVIIHLYKRYGIEQTLQLLDGVFSFILTDYSSYNENGKVYVARDPYGVRPLYVMESDKCEMVAFASELKMLSDICIRLNKVKNTKLLSKTFFEQDDLPSVYNDYSIKQFLPGTYSKYEITFKALSNWECIEKNKSYHSTGFQAISYKSFFNTTEIKHLIQFYLTNSVNKRCCTTERPIACLLSGGLDSSLITALVNDFHKINGLPTLETYSIGIAGSEDLRHARIVADYLRTNHHEVILTEEDFLKAIPDVIRAIESYDTTTVRASIGNWLLGKYISENSKAKVIFNGDGSDELCGGYLYMKKAPDNFEFDRECRRLLKDIHTFDVLRSDKSISSHGLEPRTPFLDRAWVQFYLSIPMNYRNHNEYGDCEKFLLRDAFSESNYKNSEGNSLLPKEILWRKKEAFSDGVSKQSRSLYQIIQEYCTLCFKEEEYPEYDPKIDNEESTIESICAINKKMFLLNKHIIPTTTEQFYYRKIFETLYPGMGKIIPYFWMPRYVDAKDASARTLDFYDDE
jgi:asparagine synthase (glutamine-hydrolysing)